MANLKFKRAFLGFVLSLVGISPLAAENLPVPTGDVILTVSGNITHTNVADTAQFDLEMLRDLPAVAVSTSTIWTEGVQAFVGVELADLVTAVGAKGQTVSATAINDYAISIPVSDAVPGGALLAYERNGAEMSVRDKGPLWVVYPFDQNPSYRSETYHARSIWQLDRITITE